VGQSSPGGEEAAAYVDREDTVPLRLGRVLNHRKRVDAGVLNEDIELAPAERESHEPLHIGFDRYVGPLEFGGRAAKPSREGMPTFFISVADGNEDSFLDESLHDPHADALCGTDDKGPLPVQTPL